MGDHIKESEVQTDIRMIHDLVAPNRIFDKRVQSSLSSSNLTIKTETKSTQTESTSGTTASSSSNPTLSTQSSVEDDTNPNAPVDRNKLSRRVRRHVKPGCSIAVLPSSEIIIIDPESNSMSILDRRGKFRYGMSNSNKPCTESGNQPAVTQFGSTSLSSLPKLDRGIRILTPQGNLIIKLENEVLTETPNVALAVHAYDRMAAENAHN